MIEMNYHYSLLLNAMTHFEPSTPTLLPPILRRSIFREIFRDRNTEATERIPPFK